jgi:iron complex transport system substrate-binding protein
MTTPPRSGFPERIFCLDREAAELLRRLGAGERVARVLEIPAGPAALRQEREAVSRAERCLAEIPGPRPDLVLSLVEVPEEILEKLNRNGLSVRAPAARSLEEVFEVIQMVGEILGLPKEGQHLSRELREGVERIREAGETLLRRPTVYFEEWPDPLVSAAGWVDDLVGVAGGESVFPESHRRGDWRERILDPAEVPRRSPEVIIGAWPGRRLELDRMRQRPGWEGVPAVRRGKLFEMEPEIILRPGPTALTRGLARLHEIMQEASLG